MIYQVKDFIRENPERGIMVMLNVKVNPNDEFDCLRRELYRGDLQDIPKKYHENIVNSVGTALSNGYWVLELHDLRPPKIKYKAI